MANKGNSTTSHGGRGRIVALLIALGLGVYGVSQWSPSESSSGKRNDQGDGGLPKIPTVDIPDARIPVKEGASWKEIDDPSKDGWDTEVYTGEAMKQLKELGGLLTSSDELDKASVGELIAPDFECGALRPDNLATVLDDQHLRVDRLSSEPEGGTFQGAGGLVEAMRALTEPFPKAEDLSFEVKVFRVSVVPEGVSTRQYFSFSGRTDTGSMEQHATWDVVWARGAAGEPPRMRSLRVVEFEETSSRQANGALFSDCTESALGGNSGYAEQFLLGMNHWFQRTQDRSPLELFGNPGLAVGDVNGDGLDDLYVCQESGLPNRLFVQNADGTATEQSSSWGVDWLQSSRSALLVDLDNDADQDLVVAIHGGVVVAENDGAGRFHLKEVLTSTVDTMSLSAVDYDLDGRLDLFVCGYNQSRVAGSESSGLGGSSAGFVVHDANNGGNNSLFRNKISEDGWKFIDVTAETGLGESNSRWSLAAAWDDFDNDGDQDLYVANDYGRDYFYRNDLGAERKFVDISEDARVEDSATGMSVTWGDYDRDGWMDALVSNMWSSAGNRIAFQSKFLEESTAEHRSRIQRLARGNTLLKNQGNGAFLDQSDLAGIEMGRWAWGSQFVDFNNDGWEDLVVSNGYITTDDTGDL